LQALYSLLQIADSLFPSGAFAHSYGLEGLFDGRRAVPAGDLREVAENVFLHHLLRLDGLLGLRAHRAMREGMLDRVCETDRELLAMKLARELREASTTTGRSFLAEACRIVQDPLLARLERRVASGRTPGNYSIMFHATAAAAGIPEESGLIAWGYQTAAQIAAVFLRLGLLGHRDAQWLVGRMRPVVENSVLDLVRNDSGEPASFAPQLEIASIRHERQYSRLFRS
jgi:urease accessory protein